MSRREAGRDRLEIDNMFLCGSRFTRVILKGAVVRDTRPIDARIEDVNAEGIGFENVRLANARFHDVTLEGAEIDSANLRGLATTNADLTGATIDGVLVSDLIAAWDAARGTA